MVEEKEMATLERAEEIENEFYALKAIEWACEPDEAKRLISAALVPIKHTFIQRRRDRRNGER
jgi:hypothetical protein